LGRFGNHAVYSSHSFRIRIDSRVVYPSLQLVLHSPRLILAFFTKHPLPIDLSFRIHKTPNHHLLPRPLANTAHQTLLPFDTSLESPSSISLSSCNHWPWNLWVSATEALPPSTHLLSSSRPLAEVLPLAQCFLRRSTFSEEVLPAIETLPSQSLKSLLIQTRRCLRQRRPRYTHWHLQIFGFAGDLNSRPLSNPNRANKLVTPEIPRPSYLATRTRTKGRLTWVTLRPINSVI